MKNYSQYFAIEKQLKNKGYNEPREEMIYQFTNGRKNGLKQLTDSEYTHFCHWLNKLLKDSSINQSPDWQNTPENKMRRKVFVLFVSKMGYTKKEFYNWVKKYGKYKKDLQAHSLFELTQLVTQAEQVYSSYLIEINK